MRKLIGVCIALGASNCCCYIFDKDVCGKPCTGQNKECIHFFRVARWAKTPGNESGVVK